ncbi:MAG: GFA family protein [Sphingomonadales bacterium]|nr:MAG: GFA family protein [Sphingomonadales bacterium]
MTIHAGCLCGKVRIAIEGEPLRTRTCWCRDCQYWAAGSGTTNALYRIEHIMISGDVSWYESIAESGNAMRRGFCPSCGTALFTGPAVDPKFLGVRAGAFDDPNVVRPTEVIWTASAPDWAVFDPALPHSPGQPAPIG